MTSSRRAFLGRSVAAGAAGAATSVGLSNASPGAAHAAGAYAPGRFTGGPEILATADRHLVGRFSYGVTPGLARSVRRAGGAGSWFRSQLSPAAIPDAAAERLVTWWPSLSRGPLELWQRNVQGVEGGWEVMADYARYLIARRMHSQRQVLEVMTEFWENHFNVPTGADAAFTHRTSYGRVIREKALGRFEDLLLATITHPAMLIYLDGAGSTARHPNENLGRELLELHTVGRASYSEDDVKASARILTGWSVDLWRTWEPSYQTRDHWVGPVQVLGFKDPNAAADGRDLTRRYLTYLAHHPATAQRIARKLAVKFVRDDPPQALVDRLASVYLANDTAIGPVLLALTSSREFSESVGAKVRDPGEDMVGTYRALGVRVSQPPPGPAGDQYAVNALLWQTARLGSSPFSWPQPDGQPIDNESWSSPSRLVASMDVHWGMAGGWWPREGATYRTPRAWMPKPTMRFDKLVDHLSRQVLHRPSTAQLLKACCQAVDVGPREAITLDHRLVRWNFHRLLATLLDSPAHMTR